MSRPKFAQQTEQYHSSTLGLQAQISHLGQQNELELFHVVTQNSEHEIPHRAFPQENPEKPISNRIATTTTDEKSNVSSTKHAQMRLPSIGHHGEELDAMTILKHTGDNEDSNAHLSFIELPQQRNKSSSYESKVDQFHLAEASGIKPNLFISEDNSTPTHQPNQNLVIRPQQIQPQYNPYDQHTRTNKLKSFDSRYNARKNTKELPSVPQEEQQVTDPPSKNKTRRLPSLNQNVQSSVFSNFESSTIVLANSTNKPSRESSVNPSQLTQQQMHELLKPILQPVGRKTAYRFAKEQTFGKNFIHPDFKILSTDGSIIISAKKQSFHFNSYYNITCASFGSELVLGNLRGNFGGTEFNLYRARGDEEELVATIAYQSACGMEFRKMQIFVKIEKKSDQAFETATRRKSLKELYNEGYSRNIQKLVTKDPKWNEATKCYQLSFGGKGKMPSTKNMILTPQNEPKNRHMLFCKISNDQFHLQINKSLSLFVTMGVLMSSFDFKLLCQ